MSLWGNKDTVYSTGNITTITSGGVVTGSGTTFSSSGLVEAGQVIEMGAYGSGVVKSVDSNTQLTLDSAAGLTAASGLTQAYNISESPKYLAKDSHWAGNEIYGSDPAEVAAANNTIYEHTHAGWVGITTYTDTHGNTRTKTEVFVAGSSITTDAGDDSVLADS
tara:strand:- start:1261 stop:1752 length:492 start_codon:yes stop_codon:yes gene_type:complete